MMFNIGPVLTHPHHLFCIYTLVISTEATKVAKWRDLNKTEKDEILIPGNSRTYYVYIMANVTNKTIYIGVTNDILRRVSEHKSLSIEGFSKRYRTTKLVYVEEASSPYEAISREKQLKHWRRSKKDELIEYTNPDWKDLFETLSY